MKNLEDLTVEDIEKMDYNNLISVVKETNRVPGGFKTLQQIANIAMLDNSKHMLEIGTSTGVSAIELVRLTKCKMDSIDINERSIEEAKTRAKKEDLLKYINFQVGDAQNMIFDDKVFDIVFCGNVTSLIPDRKKALNEYYRVLKNGGMLIAVPMYYIKTPSQELINNVSDAIKTNVEICDKEYWKKFFLINDLVYKYEQDFKFEYISDNEIEKFVNYILSREHLKVLKADTYKALSEKYKKYMYYFRDNLSHMGYSILVLFKENVNPEPELFRGESING